MFRRYNLTLRDQNLGDRQRAALSRTIRLKAVASAARAGWPGLAPGRQLPRHSKRSLHRRPRARRHSFRPYGDPARLLV